MATQITCGILISLIICCAYAEGTDKKEEEMPPKIISQPSKLEFAWKTGESLEIPCKAEASPPAVYRWEKNGKEYPITGIEVKQVPGEGTLVIQNPETSHEGIYQCFAENIHGTAPSIKTQLRKAFLGTFPTLTPELHKPLIGEPRILRCNPPDSYPPAIIYWGENKNQSKLVPLTNTDRMSLDFSGNLYFSNIQQEDDLDGLLYVCIAHNTELRIMVQGDDQKILPMPVTGVQKVIHPKLMWSSPENDVAITGTTKRMKCIFSGFPTPKVEWIRIDNKMPESAVHDSYGQELRIRNVTHDDGGSYQCRATNIARSTAAVKNFKLSIESAPHWRNNKPPEDVNTSEDEDAEFSCIYNGVPKPTLQWFINGVPVPIDQDPSRSKNPRRVVGINTLKFIKVSKYDASIISCNVSNQHGYIFANAYLKILAEAPYYLEPPANVTKVAEGSTAVLKCRSFGAPKPSLVWQKGSEFDDVMGLDDDRYTILDDGDLVITNVQKGDKDYFQCYLSNKFGTNASRGQLVVRDKTVITKGPRDQEVNAGGNVTFKCNATTDVAEWQNLRIFWEHNNHAITQGMNPRFHLLDNNRTLLIKNAMVSDTGRFTCMASNSIDKATAFAHLNVKDLPDSPYDVKVTDCSSGETEVMWRSGEDNNDQIQYYYAYYNTSIDEPGKYNVACKTTIDMEWCNVQLRPWANFTFHVVAENSLGKSQKSKFTTQRCTTKPSRPFRHPNLVCTESRNPNSLVIVWEPMLRTEHNGDGFHYLVSYRRRDQDFDNDENKENTFKKVKVTDWRQSELVIWDQPIFKEYVILVEAINDIGSAPDVANKIVGFSSEDAPLEAPSDFKLFDETLKSTSAVFAWRGVDTNSENIRGFFTGYQLRFWRSESPSVVRTEDMIIREWKQCHPFVEKSRMLRSLSPSPDDTYEITTNKLWPYSTITAGVVVLNGAKSSGLSETIMFQTPEGVPSTVPMFWVSERGSHHLRVSWEAPYEINGEPMGYTIKYQTEDGEESGSSFSTVVSNPNQLYKKLHDLKSSTAYKISIWAMTNAGLSKEAYTISESTVSEQSPDRPIITSIESGHDYVNISWSSGKNPKNPGKEYIVEYQKSGDSVPSETPLEDEHNWMNISDLEHGTRYLFRVVAFNKMRDSMKSEPVDYVVGVRQELNKQDSVQTSSAMLVWLIPVILLIIFLLLLFCILCFILKNNKGGTYAVFEKELLHGVKCDEEATFDEYIRSENSTFKSKQGSLESSHKSSDEEEGTDSLGAYEDVDPTKFNDDGSFVDQVTLNSKPAHDYHKL